MFLWHRCCSLRLGRVPHGGWGEGSLEEACITIALQGIPEEGEMGHVWGGWLTNQLVGEVGEEASQLSPSSSHLSSLPMSELSCSHLGASQAGRWEAAS